MIDNINQKGIALTAENATKFVTRLKKALKKNNINLQQNQCYELMAQMFGASNWHELHQHLKNDEVAQETEFNPVLLSKLEKSKVSSRNKHQKNQPIKVNVKGKTETEMMEILENLDAMFDDDESDLNSQSSQFNAMELFNQHVPKENLWQNSHIKIIEQLKKVEKNQNYPWVISDDALTLGLADTLIETLKRIRHSDKKVLFASQNKILSILSYLPSSYTYAFMEVASKHPGLLPALVLIAHNDRMQIDMNFQIFEIRIKNLMNTDSLNQVVSSLHADWIKNIYQSETSDLPSVRKEPDLPPKDNLKSLIISLIEELDMTIRKIHQSDDEYDDYEQAEE